MIYDVGRFLWWRYVSPLTDGWPDDITMTLGQYYALARDREYRAFTGYHIIQTWVFGFFWWHRPTNIRFRNLPAAEIEIDRNSGFRILESLERSAQNPSVALQTGSGRDAHDGIWSALRDTTRGLPRNKQFRIRTAIWEYIDQQLAETGNES